MQKWICCVVQDVEEAVSMGIQMLKIHQQVVERPWRDGDFSGALFCDLPLHSRALLSRLSVSGEFVRRLELRLLQHRHRPT